MGDPIPPSPWLDSRHRYAVALTLVTGAAFLIRWIHLGRYGLWTDETFTLNVARMGLSDLLAFRDQTPPLFAILLHFWMGIFGASDVAVRLPSVIAGTAAVTATAFVAKRFLPRPWALTAAGLAACSLYGIVLSQEARAYALLLLLSVLSLLTFLRWMERPDPRRSAVHALVVALLLYSHIWAIFYVAAQNLYLLFHAPRRWTSRSWIASQAAAASAFLPWVPSLLASTRHVASGFWIEAPGWDDLYWTRFILSGGHLLAWIIPPLLVWAAWSFRHGLYGGDIVGPGKTIQSPSVLWWWLVLPVAVPFAISFLYPIYTPRYTFAGTVPAIILSLMAVRGLFASKGAVIAAAILVALFAGSAAYSLLIPGAGVDARQDWPEAVSIIESQAAPGAVLVFSKGYCDSSTDSDFACSFERDMHRQDFRLVPFFFEDRGVSKPVNGTTVPESDALIGNATDVWLLYSYPSDTHHLLQQRLTQRGYTEQGTWNLKRIDMWHFTRAAAHGPTGLLH